jgi:hypothetical protein
MMIDDSLIFALAFAIIIVAIALTAVVAVFLG